MRFTTLHRRALAVTISLAAAFALPLASAPPAFAEPATSTAYPAGGTGTRYTGRAFDACTAPPLASIKAWSASPYRALGVYISGVNRFCAQPELTASWVKEVSRLGWRLIPIHKGLQPPCGAKPTDVKISLTLSIAASQGTAAATEAITAAKARGMLPGSALYNDIEFYDAANTACRNAVLKYLSSYTKKLHAGGYLSGVYMNLHNGAKNLSDAFTSTTYARPDALWIARYDEVASLTGWANIADGKWSNHQRGKQYRGSHTETYGGVTINIDNNLWDAPVATVAHAYTATSSTALNARTAPSTSAAVVRTHAPGATVQVVCQTTGSKVGTTYVWDKLSDGTYVTDWYVSTPSNTGYSAPLPRCTYPWQVNSADGLNERSGPGASYPVAGRLSNGALAWVVCQKAGTKVGTSSVWNKLDNGPWVSDYYLTNPSNTTYSKPAPRC